MNELAITKYYIAFGIMSLIIFIALATDVIGFWGAFTAVCIMGIILTIKTLNIEE
jgi:uncharacterized membrane protein